MALSTARARQIGQQMAQGGGGAHQMPVFGSIRLASKTLIYGSSAGTAIGALTCDNAFATLSLLDDAGGRVAISGGNLTVGATAATDGTSFNILVQAQIGIRTQVQTFIINVADAPITDISMSNQSITSGSAVNTVVGALTSAPTGATFTLTDDGGGHFKIVGTNVEATSTATNKAVQGAINITVHAVHGTSTFDKTFTISVT